MKKVLLLTVMCVFGLFALNAQETTVVSYDFNDGSLAGWTLNDGDGDGEGWGLQPPGSSYAGVDNTYGLFSATYTTKPLTPDNYIVTAEKFTIQADSKVTFNHMNADYGFFKEKIGVVVSSDGANYTTVWTYEYMEGALEWHEAVVELGEYAGQELHVGLRHFGCNGNTGTGIKVDNIVLSGVTAAGGEEPDPTPGEDPEPTPGEATLVTLGSGNTTAEYIPLNTWFEYAASQQIYTADELAAAGFTTGAIKSIAFKSAHAQVADRDVMIFLLNTDKAAFTTTNGTTAPYETVTESDLVYEGTLSITGIDEWCSVEFAAPFTYTGNNILVFVVDKSGNYKGNANTFYTYAAENSSINLYQDNAAYDPYNMTNGGTLQSVKNQVQFGIVTEGGEEPEPNEGATEFVFNFDEGTFDGLRTFIADGAYCLGWQTNPEDPYGVMGPYYSGTDGTYGAVSISSDPMTGTLYKPNSYLVTEDAYLMTSTSKLSWNVKFPFSTASGPDYYEIVVSTDNETFNSIWSEEKYAISNLEARELSLSEYAGQKLYIGFRHYRETSNANAGFICIDDVVLSSEGGGEEPEPQVPAAPANVVAQATGETTIALTWDAVEGATSYKVYDEEDVIAETEETTYTVEGLAAATNYCFIVTAVNEVGESFASAQSCATTDEEQQQGDDQLVTLGEGTNLSYLMPYYDYYGNTFSQQIYTAAEISAAGFLTGTINSIAFKAATEAINVRQVLIFMANTDTDMLTSDEWGTTTFEPVISSDLVYEGTMSGNGLDQWSTVELTTPFLYTGGNILLTVVDNTNQWVNNMSMFYTYNDNNGRAAVTYRDNENYDPYAMGDLQGMLQTSKNQVQFGVTAADGITVNVETIDLGAIALGNYWPEKAAPSVGVTIAAAGTTVTEITSDNSFFVIPADIDLTAMPIKFSVTHDNTAGAGEKSGNLTIVSTDETVVIPMTATVYEPVEPDVFELATEITFTDNAYTNTPDFATLHDDYVLPNEAMGSNAPDAAYTFSLDGNYVIKAGVEGAGGFYAVYRADSIGNGNGPKATNNYNGKETILETAFEYDFADGSLDAFTLQNNDEYADFNWMIEDGKLVSYSYYGWYDENDEYQYITEADERIITNESYDITPYTVLTFDLNRYESSTYQTLVIEVTQDGETFTEIGTAQVQPNYVDDYPEYYPELFDENGNYITFRRIDLGAAFIAAGLEYGSYQIVLHNNVSGAGQISVDNLTLTERAGVYEAGDYYLVAAAKEAFTLNVELMSVNVEPEVPAAPTNVKAEATGSNSIMVSWDAVEGAMYYGIYKDGEWAVAVAETSYEFVGLGLEATYCFTVITITEVDDQGIISVYSEQSEEACATTLESTVSPPSNVVAEATGPYTMTLSWDAVDGALAYGVYHRGTYLGATYETSVQFGELAPATEYCFTVVSVTELDEDGIIISYTGHSEEACATTDEAGILPPTNVVAEATGPYTITLSWDAVEGAIGYGIFYAGQYIGSTYDTSVMLEELEPETEYCFTVMSISEIDEEGYIVGYSEQSEEACATTHPDGVAELGTAFNIYPNPVNDVLFVESGANVEQVTVYNVTGVMVYSQECAGNNVQINVSDLEGGVYIVKVRTENNEVISRFVKK